MSSTGQPSGRFHRTLANGFGVTHTFDAAGRETFIGYWSGTNILQASYSATYDAVANRLSQREIDGSVVSWGYDAANQLLSEQRTGTSAYNISYQYDPACNRLVKSDSGQVSRYNYNAANELVVLTPPSGAATTFTWDGNGNTLVQIVGSARTTYTWDGENRLLGVLFSNGQRETYSYAADGLRRKKVDISGLQSLYVWDEENLLLWTDQSFNFQNQYTQYPGQWGGMVSERHTGSSFFYGFDLAANTRFMAQISGSITDHYLYRAFGDGEVVSGSNFNPYQYGGQYGYYQEAIAVEGSQRYYVRARHLRVDLGRWVTRDPLGSESGGGNLYLYAGNSPTAGVDPNGWAVATRRPVGDRGSVSQIVRNCLDRSRSYCQKARAEKYQNRADNCFCFVSDTLCLFIIRLPEVLGPAIARTIDCLNKCMWQHWKNNDTSAFQQARRTCKMCGNAAPQCCLQTIAAEQKGLSECRRNHCPGPLPPSWLPSPFPFSGTERDRIARAQHLCCVGRFGNNPDTNPLF